MSIATLIVPDVHGNLDMAAGLLRAAGAIDEGGARIARDDLRTVQLGDLCNCVGASLVDDARCLDHVEEWFDVYLVGNHEHPYFGGPAFSGFWRDPVLERRLRGLYDGGLVQPSVVVDGILVTHAGVTPSWGFRHAFEADEFLRRWWVADPGGAPAFAQIGCARGGRALTGGILWSDWLEPKAQNLRQIVGHTVGRDVRRVDFESRDGWALCIDLGGGKHGDRLAGALVRDGAVEIVVYDRTAGRACRVCGCTDAAACLGGCSWIDIDLCSRCAA